MPSPARAYLDSSSPGSRSAGDRAGAAVRTVCNRRRMISGTLLPTEVSKPEGS